MPKIEIGAQSETWLRRRLFAKRTRQTGFWFVRSLNVHQRRPIEIDVIK